MVLKQQTPFSLRATLSFHNNWIEHADSTLLARFLLTGLFTNCVDRSSATLALHSPLSDSKVRLRPSLKKLFLSLILSLEVVVIWVRRSSEQNNKNENSQAKGEGKSQSKKAPSKAAYLGQLSDISYPSEERSHGPEWV